MSERRARVGVPTLTLGRVTELRVRVDVDRVFIFLLHHGEKLLVRVINSELQVDVLVR